MRNIYVLAGKSFVQRLVLDLDAGDVYSGVMVLMKCNLIKTYLWCSHMNNHPSSIEKDD